MTPMNTGGSQVGAMNSAQPFAADKMPQKRSGPRLGVIIGIVVLLILLVGGAFVGYLYVNTQHTVNTTTPTVSSPAPSGPPLFADSFNDNTNGWNLMGITGKFSVSVGKGAMVLEDDNNRLLWELVPNGKTFNNFKLTVDASLSKGDQNNGYGIYIRGASNQNSDLATYYRFELYGDSTYAIFKGSVDATGATQSSRLVDYTSNSAIKPQGGLNHITIIAKGSSLLLIVNGQTLKTITDNSYTNGSVALFVSNLQNAQKGAQATFSHLAIYPTQA